MNKKSIQIAKSTIAIEIEALRLMSERLGEEFQSAVEIITASSGRVAVLGMGKSGIIAKKIAATLASTGTAAFFVHPAEAFHGDLGMIQKNDVVLMISNSGETEEIIRLFPFLKHQGNKLIAATGDNLSTLSSRSDVVLDVHVNREACDNNLAPTASTTAALVMGDALAMALSYEKNFRLEDFARFHPGGILGKRLLTRVKDIMQTKELPLCTPDTSFKDLVHTTNKGRMGLAVVMKNKSILGLITDGDIRRALDGAENIKSINAKNIMTPNPKTTKPNVLMTEAEELMHLNKISSLIVTDDNEKLLGILQLHNIDIIYK
jgi:arabinose-5-phosphate isomerase